MIALILTAFSSLVAGMLLGGCNKPDDEITRDLLNRNAQLENQAAAHHDALTALAVTLILSSCALGISLYRNLRGARGGKEEQ